MRLIQSCLLRGFPSFGRQRICSLRLAGLRFGIWLGAIALEQQQRVDITPLFNRTLNDSSRFRVRPEETLNFLSRFGLLVPDTRRYSHNFGWRRELAYRLSPGTPMSCNQAYEPRY
jgi:hypothetical protein